MLTPLDRRFGGMGAAVLVLVAALIALGLQTAGQLRENIADLDRARDMQVRVQRITAVLLDMETSQRGYLLTQEEPYLEPYRAAVAGLDHELEGLGAAAADHAAESAELRRLRGLVDERNAELARTITLVKAQRLSDAWSIVRENRGRALMDEIRLSLRRLDEQVAATLAERQAARAVSIRRNELFVFALCALLVLLLGVLYVLHRRERALRDRTEADEATARQRLEQRVSERTAELEAASERLATSEDRLRGIFESASEGILSTDAHQIIVAANAASARMFRCQVSDLIGTPLDRLIPERYRAAHRQSVDAFGAGAVTAQAMRRVDGRREVQALRFDGEEFPIEASISRTEVDGQRLYTVIHRDLTEQRRAAAALHDSQQLMAATFDASAVAMAQIDPRTRRFLAVNDALCRLSGYSRPELLTMGPDDLNHPDDRLDEGALGGLLRGDGLYREEKRLVRKDGGWIWAEIAGSVVRDARGEPVRLIGLLQDITARRQAEQALRARERRQDLLVRLNDRLRALDDPQAIAYEASCLLGEFAQVDRVGYAEDDGNGDTITVARHYTHQVPGIEGRFRYEDYGPALLAALREGRTVVRPDIAHDPSLSDHEKAAHAALQLGATVNVPLIRDARLQAVFFVHSTAARAWSDDDVALFEDVAQRIRADVTRAGAQAAERAASARLKAALDSMSDAVLISDAEGRFLQFNSAFVSFHRFRSPDECLRTLAEYADILDVHQADGSPAPLAQWAVPRALRGETASNVEYRLRRKDSGETWVGSYSFAPIRADDGEIVGSVVSGRDITQAKKTQEELATSYAALEHLIANQQRVQEDERKRIARELHDDLQQSLAAIRMDALAVGERVAKGRGDIEPLLARIDRLSGVAIASARRIVSDLRPEMLEELGLRPALEALCAEHAQRWGAECRLELSGMEAAAHLDNPVLSIGLFRIAQEALNNVAKHAKASLVKVHLDATQSGLIILRIADNGIGLRPREKRDPQSFGLLGMRERVRAMGGQLRVEAPGERGTMIEVLVPTLDLHPAEAGAGHGIGQLPAELAEGPGGLGVWDVWGRPLQAVIDALDGNVAVVDAQGTVKLVNRAWREFAAAHGDPGLAGCGLGVNYLEVCRRSAAEEPTAETAAEGLSAVLEGRDAAFALTYACDTPAGSRWFRLHAASITGGLTIVAHVEIHGPLGRADAGPAPGG